MIGRHIRTTHGCFAIVWFRVYGASLGIVKARNGRSMLLLTSAITCGYIYQFPPFRLSNQNLGEPLCFSAFGPFATTTFYLLQVTFTRYNFSYGFHSLSNFPEVFLICKPRLQVTELWENSHHW